MIRFLSFIIPNNINIIVMHEGCVHLSVTYDILLVPTMSTVGSMPSQ